MDYSSYKFYRGGEECPEKFDSEQSRLWNAERIFEMDFQKNESSDWYAFLRNAKLAVKTQAKYSSKNQTKLSTKSLKIQAKNGFLIFGLTTIPAFFACRRIGVEDE